MPKLFLLGLTAAGLALGGINALGQESSIEKRRETLLVLYEARWTETVCDFRFSDAEKAKLADATAFIEGRLTDTPEQKKSIDDRAKAFVEQVKAERKCEADGEFHKVVRKMISDLPDPQPAKPAQAR